MQFSIKKNSRLRTVIFFGIVLFLALLPVSSFLFYIKNDAFINYFPPKFFMSESLHDGYLPLWNPYINFGIPQYADMNAGYWSPVTWLIAGTVGYNAYSFTLETLFYILLGGLGMYTLSGCWIRTTTNRFIAGIAFMCCGYHIGHLQHFNWLAASAFLPWCMWSYVRLNEKGSLHNILTAVLLFYLFIASAHPGQIIGSVYLFIPLAIFIFFSNKNFPPRKKLLRFTGIHLAFAGALLLLSAGIIAGYTDIIPHFMRGSKLALEDTLQHSSGPVSWISVLLPMATVKNEPFFITDISLRNSYFGLLLILFLLVAMFSKKTNWQKFFLFTGLFFLLLSAGGMFKNFAFHYLPFIGYVRLGGEFRIFTILCFILVAGIQLEKYRQSSNPSDIKKINRAAYFLGALLSAAVVFALYNILVKKDSILFHARPAATGFAQKIKDLIDDTGFYDTIALQGTIQLIFLALIIHCLRHKKFSLLKYVFVADMVLASLLNVPFTGAGKTSLAHVQGVLDKSPEGIPVPVLQPISKNDTLTGPDNYLLGYWNMYNKQPGTMNEMPYPIQLRNMRAYFDNVEKKGGYDYGDKAFLYTDSSRSSIQIRHFSPNNIQLDITTDSSAQLIFLQNRYPHWYYKNSAGTFPAASEGFNFMRIPLQKGRQEITLFFNPGFIRTAIFISAGIFLLYVLLIVFYPPKRSSLS